MDSKTYQISKLEGNNYFIWKLKIKMLLQKEKLWSVLEESPPDPMTPEWSSRDQGAQATMGLTLDDRILITTANCQTAKEMWDLLKNTYEHKGLASRIFLLKKLYSAQYQTFNNMETYLSGILELVERLRAIKEEVKDHHLIAIILCGLPPSYNPLITAFETREGDELKLNYVLEKLRDEASRVENQDSNIGELDAAMGANQIYSKRLITCHHCHKNGHIRRNCPQLKERPTAVNKEGYKTYYSMETGQQNEEELSTEWALNTREVIQESSNLWIVDSGASIHMSPRKEIFQDMRMLDKPVPIKLANGEYLMATGEGSVNICGDEKMQDTLPIRLGKVLYVPHLKSQLLSVIVLCEEGYKVHFYNDRCEIFNYQNERIIKGKRMNKSYVIRGTDEYSEVTNVCVHQWHDRLGHRSHNDIKKMTKENKVQDFKISTCNHDDFCVSCQMGSMKRSSFKTSKNISKVPFKTIVSDLCGPISPCSVGGNNYVITLTDEASNYTKVGLLRSKSDAVEHIQNFIKKGRTKFGYYPEIFRSDEGGEYLGRNLRDFFDHHGIIHQTSVAYTPQQNGRAEKKNLTLLDMTRCMIKSSGLPKFIWGEAINTACYILNRLVHSATNKTPYELWHGSLPSLDHLRSFGCQAFALVPSKLRTKLDNTSRLGYMVGYGIDKKCYRIWDPKSNKIINTISVKFNESSKYSDQKEGYTKASDQNKVYYEINGEFDVTEGKLENEMPIRRSQRTNFGVPPNKLTY